MKALGWYVDEQDLAQVSMNLCDFETTPLHVAFEECSKDAKVSKPQCHVSLHCDLCCDISVAKSRSGWVRNCWTGSTPSYTHGGRLLH